MALIGTAIAGALGAYGSKPKVPQFKPIDLTQVQADVSSANLSSLAQNESLASKTNAFNQQQYDAMLESALPGYNQIKNKIGQNIGSMVNGELPQDVADQIARQSASRALYGGYGGTGMGRNLTARDLGLTSLQMTQQGLDAATRWMSAAKAPQFDLSSMFVTPVMGIQTAEYNSTNQFNRDWLRNQIKAMPDPFMQALGQAFIADESSISSMLGSAAGGASGGGGGGGSSM